MKITIDNFDGRGAVDYCGALSGPSSVVIERRLNQPSRCEVTLLAGVLPAPANGARVIAASDDGTILFTGYQTAAPEFLYEGEATTGPAYRLRVSCASDELLLDATVSRHVVECVATSAGTLLQRLSARTDAGAGLATTGDALSIEVGGFQPRTGKSWSSNVGELATAAHAAYKVENGVIELNSLGGRVHVLSEADGTLDRSAFRGARVRPAVNDVTVYGKEEPQAYVCEVFQGDGITSVFQLGEAPLLERSSLLTDTFNAAHIDPHVWSVNDGGGHVTLTSRGLTFAGGTNNTPCSVSAVDTVEMGGVLTLELGGLVVDALGEGYVGLASGSLQSSNIFAGFHLRPNGGAMVAVPVVQGVEAGSSATLQIGHSYSLRLRFHCKDRQRALQTYSAGSTGSATRLGGQRTNAAADLVMEIQETTAGGLLPAAVLYDGSVTMTPTLCTPVAMSSVNFLGSIASLDLTRPGDVWVRVANGGSAPVTQRLGVAGQSAQAKVSSSGRLSFYPGNTPPAGSVISIYYRLGGRAVARMAGAAATAAATSSVIVTASHPETRSSADCENAALALLSVATWPEGAWKGSYSGWSPQLPADVWPGDLLQVNAPSMGVSTQLLVRSVEVRGSSCVPEALHSTVSFANEWAEPVALRLAEGAPANAWLPPVASTSSTALDCLRDLAVLTVTKTEIQIQAGAVAPAGGGFEVRRSDWKFGAGAGADLVLQSPVSNFTIVREAPVERYYIRMYDGATPPNYSRFSSAVFINAATQ